MKTRHDTGTLLGVWAHPDDEALLSAGLMAQAVADGHRVVVVTATRGEHGTSNPAAWPPQRLADLRTRELAASLAALGVTEHHWLGYVDGTCADVPPQLGSNQIASIIDEVSPDTIVTFGPDGLTGHPDHRTVSAWTDQAIARTGYDATLLHVTKSRDHLDEFADIHEEFNVFFAGDAPWTDPTDLALEFRPDPAILDTKVASLQAQASQMRQFVDAYGIQRFRDWVATEWFVDGRLGAAAAAA